MHKPPDIMQDDRRAAARNGGTPLLLWLLWALSVVAAAGHIWHGAVSAEEPVNLVRLVVRCTVVGLLGLIVITLLEIWLTPWRFIDE